MQVVSSVESTEIMSSQVYVELTIRGEIWKISTDPPTAHTVHYHYNQSSKVHYFYFELDGVPHVLYGKIIKRPLHPDVILCRCQNSHLTIDTIENIRRMKVGISLYARRQGEDATFLTDSGQSICHLTLSTAPSETNYQV